MLFSDLVRYSAQVRNAAGRNQKVGVIVDFLEHLEKDEAEIGVAFMSGAIRQGKLNLAWTGLSSLISTTAHAAGQPVDLRMVDGYLERCLRARGREKAEVMRPLFIQLDILEKRYLAALIIGDVRQGAAEGLVRQAIARYFGLDEETLVKAGLHMPVLWRMHAHLLAHGRDSITGFGVKLFQPLKPMLAETAGSLDEIFGEHAGGELAVEHKLDGIRIQVHRHAGEIRIFSRHLKDITSHFPDIASALRDLPGGDFIVDGEAVGIDAGGNVLPFQKLSRRTTRKKDIEAVKASVPAAARIFDVLYAGGRDLTARPYDERRGILKEIVPAGMLTPQAAAPGKDAARAFFDDSVQKGNEGIVVKLLSSGYHAGKRGAYWFKIKRVHTIDCVILAADWGHGRRKGWLSNLHLGVLDETRSRFLMVGKTFKGLTDDMLGWLTGKLGAIKVHEDRWTVHVKPEVVVEVGFNDVQDSRHYDSRCALRFARIKSFRPDKNAHEVNTVLDLERLKGKGERT